MYPAMRSNFVMSPSQYISALSEHYGPLQLDFDLKGESFEGYFKRRPFAAGSIASMYANHSHYCQRKRAGLRKGPRSLTMTLLINGGCNLRNGEDVAECSPGDLWLLDSDGPLVGVQHGPLQAMSLSIPLELVRGRFPFLERVCATPIKSSSGSATILRDVLLSLWREQREISTSQASTIISSVLDLAAAAFMPVSDSENLQCSLAHHYRRLHQLIIDQYWDPELSVSRICDSLGLSRTYLYAVTRHHGTTIEKMIYDIRLDEARKMVVNPAFAGRSISDIAYATGFDSLSHFSRRYRNRFGESPGTHRAAILGRAIQSQ